MNDVTIVMYHYVRDYEKTDFPQIKGLDIRQFRKQLDYLQKEYHLIGYADLVRCLNEGIPLPPKACWLTFDDGYSDHYEYVFPELKKRGLEASFFPVASAVKEGKILDVNKIHFILAKTASPLALLEEIETQFDQLQGQLRTGKSFKMFEKELAIASRWDPKEIVFIKRLLQHALPADMRLAILDTLFKMHVSSDPIGFAASVYLSQNQLKEMLSEGMHLGSHGVEHSWMGKATREVQTQEIQGSLRFLAELGIKTTDWAMCYPYGSFNEQTLALLEANRCLIGITTEVGNAQLSPATRLVLPRMNTNDFPR